MDGRGDRAAVQRALCQREGGLATEEGRLDPLERNVPSWPGVGKQHFVSWLAHIDWGPAEKRR